MEVPRQREVTFEEYLQLPEGAPYQLVGGSLVHEPAPTTVHQTVCLNIASAMRAHVRSSGSGRVFTAPTDVRLTPSEIYQPDVMAVRAERLHIISTERVEGAPDLVVEVLSPSSAYYDLRHKRDVYARTGVREYWIVDPIERSVDVLENRDGRYVPMVEGLREGSIVSAVLEGFSIDVDEVFRLE